MTDQSTEKNSAAKALPIIGVLAAILGGVLWATGASQLAHDKLVNEFGATLSGGLFSSGNTDGDQALIWWGIALVVLGAVMLVARFIIAAAQK
jgi:hypothetical protein